MASEFPPPVTKTITVSNPTCMFAEPLFDSIILPDRLQWNIHTPPQVFVSEMKKFIKDHQLENFSVMIKWQHKPAPEELHLEITRPIHGKFQVGNNYNSVYII